ncbi:MAG: hypothetical protein IPM63_15170 [Acidobacteriota bacterium]|nr:MAG: hypothetical protein IPM63_15170 [Acidobacteriota bacterium]
MEEHFQKPETKKACDCANLPDFFLIDYELGSFPQDLELLESNAEGWLELKSCKLCAVLWVVDAWDWGSNGRAAFRVNRKTGWEDTDTIKKRKELLLKSRGGLTDETCCKAGCERKALVGVALCLDHYYDLGWRR